MLFLGFPLYLALGLGAVLVSFYYGGLPLIAVSTFFYNNLYSFTLLAIPLFILAGFVMVEGGTAEHLVKFINAWFGRLRGGLAIAMVVACTFFGALSGSSFACAAAIGTENHNQPTCLHDAIFGKNPGCQSACRLFRMAACQYHQCGPLIFAFKKINITIVNCVLYAIKILAQLFYLSHSRA